MTNTFGRIDRYVQVIWAVGEVSGSEERLKRRDTQPCRNLNTRNLEILIIKTGDDNSSIKCCGTINYITPLAARRSSLPPKKFPDDSSKKAGVPGGMFMTSCYH